MTCVYDAVSCDHSRMTECCPGCGHFSCPCGIVWDDGYEGYFPEEDDPNDPALWDYARGAA